MTKIHTAEIVTFRAREGVDPDQMVALAAGIGPWLSACPGFVARTLSLGPDGVWTDHVLWASHEAAMAAGQAIMAEPTAQAFMAAIDGGSVRMGHGTVRLRQA